MQSNVLLVFFGFVCLFVSFFRLVSLSWQKQVNKKWKEKKSFGIKFQKAIPDASHL